jgi:CheY-like chemotaxis protein
MNYDIIFMDCNMPVMDGFQASETIHNLFESGSLRNMPTIVALTAYSTKGFMDKASEHKMTKFMTKPIQVDDIEKLLIEHKLLK